MRSIDDRSLMHSGSCDEHHCLSLADRIAHSGILNLAEAVGCFVSALVLATAYVSTCRCFIFAAVEHSLHGSLLE